MYTGTLISDLFAVVERAEQFSRRMEQARVEQTKLPIGEAICECRTGALQTEKLPQSLCLRPADRNLGLLLIVHP
jgi:hypothetical protein